LDINILKVTQMKMLLDSNNIIIQLAESWNHNLIVPSKALIDSEIIGKPLSRYISGDMARMAVNSALHYTRITKYSLKKNYRCDGPDVNRYCEMQLTLLNDGVVQIEHSLLRIEYKPTTHSSLNRMLMKEYLLDKSVRCCMCSKYYWHGVWLEIKDFSVISKKSVFQLYNDTVDKTTCGSCLKNVKEIKGSALQN
jgi:hypothetical protein